MSIDRRDGTDDEMIKVSRLCVPCHDHEEKLCVTGIDFILSLSCRPWPKRESTVEMKVAR